MLARNCAMAVCIRRLHRGARGHGLRWNGAKETIEGPLPVRRLLRGSPHVLTVHCCSPLMPELPDVEVNKQYFDSTALHQTIEGVEVIDDILTDTSKQAVQQALRGTTFEETRRHGKHLFARLGRGRWLGLHFGMSGRLVYYKRKGEDAAYEYFRVTFDNGYRLALVIPRKLGRVRVIDAPDDFIEAHELGPDALRLDQETLVARLVDRRGLIKSALMDQGVIAGIGNIYSDEILFQAGIHPRTDVQALDEKALRSLFDAMQEVLAAAIDCGADPNQLPADRFLLPHRGEDNKDPYTGADLKQTTVAGRTSYYSPDRQGQP